MEDEAAGDVVMGVVMMMVALRGNVVGDGEVVSGMGVVTARIVVLAAVTCKASVSEGSLTGVY